jgi:hypothetical protein
MQTRKHSSAALAIAFLVLLFSAGLGGRRAAAQGTEPDDDPNVSPGQEKIVKISLVNGVPTPDVKLLRLSHGKGEIAHWILEGDGTVRIEFKDKDKTKGKGANFSKREINHAGKHARSWKPRRDAIGKTFHYVIFVTMDQKTLESPDPDIEIVP